ncbi:MAG: phosphoribosylamine--glycine ligase [Phycisphaerales bacterium]|nr:phosphoribosylamine--glycine ligase [Phycisphaerales bacterium]
MKVLIIGKGGRENALAWKVSTSPLVTKIYALPGNVGMKKYCELVKLSDEDIAAITQFAVTNKIDLTIVGPESTLVRGIVNHFERLGLKIFGPTLEAAEIEGSKTFMKNLMKKYKIPTPNFQAFTDYYKAEKYIKKMGAPIVIKADGLAAGKGVVVAFSEAQALSACKNALLHGKFGESGKQIVVEDYVVGKEFSFMVMVNGDKVYPLELAKDFKRAYDQDKGPNTGGMGAYSPVPDISPEQFEEALEKIMKPTAQALLQEGRPFKGVLYGGLIATDKGITVIEFNARFGDPEIEVLLPRMKSDIVQVILDVLAGKQPVIEWRDEVCLGVVLASNGYPKDFVKNVIIRGTESIGDGIFHMGTDIINKQLVNVGGRVLFSYALAKNFTNARAKAYNQIEQIQSGGLFYRKDIGVHLK